MKGLMIRIDCQKCGNKHELLLDESGHFHGPLPCNPEEIGHLQVDPQIWRELMAEYQASVIH